MQANKAVGRRLEEMQQKCESRQKRAFQIYAFVFQQTYILNQNELYSFVCI